MAYRDDSDLNFIGELSSEELNELVLSLTKDKDGKSLLTEGLTSSELYKDYYPEHIEYWQLIAAELQHFGGNSLSTLLRGGKGVLYIEILKDVCGKLKINIDKNESAVHFENEILTKVIGDSLEKMSDSERVEFAKTIGFSNLKDFTPAAFTAAIQFAFKAGGFKSYQLTLIVANAVTRAILGRGLTFAGNAVLMRTASLLTGPFGWALTGVWTVVDIAGPAYRVTIPAVIQVALLRKTYEAKRDGILESIKAELNR